MTTLLTVLSFLFDPRGRMSRWGFLLVSGIILSCHFLLDLSDANASAESSRLMQLAQFALLCSAAACAIKRLHDTGRSGWWILAGLVGFCIWAAVVALVSLVIFGKEVFTPGQTSSVVLVGLLMLPGFAMMLWLQLAHGDALRNLYGLAPMDGWLERHLAAGKNAAA